jgi:hypothetical protein
MVTIRLRDHANLTDAVNKAVEARRGASYTVHWANGYQGIYNLNQLLDKLMNDLRGEALGAGVHAGWVTGAPFSVAAVIQGARAYENVVVSDGGDVHRALEGLTNFSQNWQAVQLPALVDRQLELRAKSSLPNHILYGDKRGRVVWFPYHFSPKLMKNFKIGCYHRNLVLASLHTESLGEFVRRTAVSMQAGSNLSYNHSSQAKRALKVLDKFHAKSVNTYRTWSTRAQIEANGYLPYMAYLELHL